MSLSAVALVGTGATINTVAAFKQKRDPFPMLLATGIFLWLVVGIDEVTPKLGTAFASAFLLVSFLEHGTEILGVVNQQASSVKPLK